MTSVKGTSSSVQVDSRMCHKCLFHSDILIVLPPVNTTACYVNQHRMRPEP